MVVTSVCPEVDDFDLALLQHTQAYLECRSRRLIPSVELLAAWERFYRVYDPLIRRFATAFHVPKDSQDDCIQQVWTELVKKLPGPGVVVSGPGCAASFTARRLTCTDGGSCTPRSL
jgi:hypothetical protein